MEILSVAGVQREIVGQRRRGDHQVDRTAPTWLAAGAVNPGVDSTVCASTVGVEGNGFKVRLDLLKLELAACLCELIASGVWPRRKLSQCKGRNRDLAWELTRVEGPQVDGDRRVDQTSIVSQPSSEA